MSQPVTLKDIAREADLSIAAVSHALNGSPRVSEQTRRRVREISKNLGYQPRRRHKHRTPSQNGGLSSLGMLLLDERSPTRYMGRWISGITQVAQRANVRLELGQIQGRDSNWESELRRHAQGVDGLLMHGYVRKDLTQAIERLPIPVVVIGDAESLDARPRHQISVDALAMGAFATQTLLAAGHRRIGFFCPKFSPGGWFDRWRMGYQITMLRSQAGYDPRFCYTTMERSRYALGLEAAEYMNSLPDPPTAYIVPEIRRSASFQQAMLSMGGHVGPDNLIMGGEPHWLTDHGLEEYPILTENAENGAEHAVQWLMRLGRGETAPGQIIIPFGMQNFERLRQHTADVKHVC